MFQAFPVMAIRQAGGHPNLTALREHFQDDSSGADAAYYLVMDLVPKTRTNQSSWETTDGISQ